VKIGWYYNGPIGLYHHLSKVGSLQFCSEIDACSEQFSNQETSYKVFLENQTCNTWIPNVFQKMSQMS